MSKLRTIVIDTVTQIQENQYMTDSKKPGHDKWKDYAQDLYGFILALQELGFELVIILGPPGTGKSSGMRTLDPNTTLWYNTDKKNPTWTGGRANYGTKMNPIFPRHQLPNTYADIINNLVDAIKHDAFEESDRIAFIIGHTETFKEGMETRVRWKTLGNLTNKMQVEGKMETVMYSAVEMENGTPRYVLETQNNGYNTARSYMGMFEGKIDNDYQHILEKILELPSENSAE